MKGNISINVIIYVVIGIVIMAAIAFAVKDAIDNVDGVECAAGEEFCGDDIDLIPGLPSGENNKENNGGTS